MSTSAHPTSTGKVPALVIRSAIIAALGGLLFGFDSAVISGTTQNLRELYSLSEGALGFTVAIGLVGTMVAALGAGPLADRFGRRNILFAIGLVYIVSALGTALVSNWALFVIFRFIGGLGIGASSVVAPIYTAEIAPARLRGRLVGMVQLNVVIGILVAYLSNWAFASTMPYDTAWRWMLGVAFFPSVIFFFLVFTVPETPRWLYAHGREDEARATVARLTAGPEEAEREMRDITDGAADDEAAGAVKFFTRRHMKIIWMAVAIAAFNQLSGINAIMYFAPDIFRMAGAGENAAFLQSIAIGAMNLVSTMLALTVIDKIGRRKLMIVGSIGYLISLGAIAFVFFTSQGHFTGTSSVLVLAGLLLFIASHAFGQGSVIWVFISEIFPSRLRARGQALGSFTHWFFAAVISWTFPAVAGSLGGGWAFAVFFVCMIGQLFWVLKVMPETKGVPLEAMEERLLGARD